MPDSRSLPRLSMSGIHGERADAIVGVLSAVGDGMEAHQIVRAVQQLDASLFATLNDEMAAQALLRRLETSGVVQRTKSSHPDTRGGGRSLWSLCDAL